MFCRNCGKALPSDAKFCGACGVRVRASDFGEPNKAPSHPAAIGFESVAPPSDTSAPQPPKQDRITNKTTAIVPYIVGGVAMAIVCLSWVAAFASLCTDGINLVASTLDGTAAALAFLAFTLSCLIPAMLAFVATSQVIRGFVEQDFSRTARRVLQWAWPCLLITIACMSLGIAFNGLNGDAWSHVLSGFCTVSLGASVTGVIFATVAILALTAAPLTTKGYEPLSGLEGTAP